VGDRDPDRVRPAGRGAVPARREQRLTARRV
jgi:hypothetical protein